MAKLHYYYLRTIFLLLVFLTAQVGLLALPSPAVAGEIDIKPAANVDERLFILRVLETLYETWPSDISDPNVFVAAVTEHRTTAIRMREHCRREMLGTDLEACFNEFIESLDAYTDFLASIDQIKREVAEQAKKDQFNAGFTAGMSGASTYGAMRQGDYSSGQAAAFALFVGGVQYLVDSWEKADRRGAEERRAVSAAATALQDRITTSLVNAQAAARKLTESHGWGRSEAGFELDERRAAHVLQLLDDANIEGLLRVYNDAVISRPRDPFVRLYRNLCRALADEGNVGATLRHALDCLDTASLVPEGRIYDDYRAMCVAYAGFLALDARSYEIQRRINPFGSTAASQLAVSCFDWLIQNTGTFGASRAWSLMADGQLEAAFEQASHVLEMHKNDADFSYCYACLMSRMGKTKEAAMWLRAAIRSGFYNVAMAKTDPDLDNLRLERPGEFAEIIAVKSETTIHYGLFNDDITLTNKSDFPITNVVLDLRLEQDGRVWTRKLETDIIMPGQPYRWARVVSIPGNRLTSFSATLTCDQNR